MVDVIVPWRPGCKHRARAWRYLRDRYEAEGWRVVEAPAAPGPWCKASAVAPAIEASRADIVAVVDADVWCEGFERAVYAVAVGLARWAMPHGEVLRLDQEATDAFLAGEYLRRFARAPYKGLWGGGIVVGERAAFLETPLDPRFTSWGQEDQSWGFALACLHGPGWRGTSDLWHLWHPPQERLTDRMGSSEGWELFLRYRKARYDPEAMRALIDEAREDTWARTI